MCPGSAFSFLSGNVPDSSVTAIGDMSQGKRKRTNEPRSALIVTSSRRWPGHFRRLWNGGSCQDDLYAYASRQKGPSSDARSCHRRHNTTCVAQIRQMTEISSASGKYISTCIRYVTYLNSSKYLSSALPRTLCKFISKSDYLINYICYS